MSSSSYDDATGSGSKSVLWNGAGLAGRQALLVGFSLLLARILGPESFGIVAQATVYMSLTTLLLDQGISAALISSKSVDNRVAGAAITLNVALAVLIGLATLALAFPIADFFRTPELVQILWVLGGALWIKALAVVPRMLLSRAMNFKGQALADVLGAVVGGGVAVWGALNGWAYWSLVFQSVASDVVIAVMLLLIARPPLPNRHVTALRSTFGFSARVLTSNLVSYTVQNVGTILIGRFMDTQSVAYYSLANRVLATPVQMVGLVVTRVLFPAISRARHRRQEVAPLIFRSVQSISLISFPLMALIAISAPQSVPLVLGPDWLPVIPVLIIFAISGARQSVTTINTTVMMGMGRADVTLRFSFLAAALQITGIVSGLFFGIVGVAAGFTLAGFLLTPVICVLQKKIAQFGYRAQFTAIWPALHASSWASLGYWIVAALSNEILVTLIVGALVFVIIFGAVLRLIHRRTWSQALANARGMIGR